MLPEGKIKAAIKFIENNSECGVLPMTDDVIEKLKEKHPEAAIVHPESLLLGHIQPPNPAYFADINETSILKAAMHTHGSGGPSQLDAEQYRRILCNKHFFFDRPTRSGPDVMAAL